MKQNFLHQTGAVGFSVNITPSSESGDASIHFGCNGLARPTFSFHIESGNIKDSDGVYFGSIRRSYTSNISGTWDGYKCLYYYNGIPIRADYSTEKQDINYIEFIKSGNNNSTYEIDYNIFGGTASSDKTALFISPNPQLESGIINLLSGMSMFSGQSGIITGYQDYTGWATAENSGIMRDVDLIVIGKMVPAESIYYDLSGIRTIETPMIFLSAFSAPYWGVDISTTELVNSAWQAESGQTFPSNMASRKTWRDRILSKIELTTENKFRINNLQTGIYAGLTQTDYVDEASYPIALGDIDANPLSFIEVLGKGYSGSYSQAISGQRVVFNLNSGSDQNLTNVDENWKKMFMSSVFLLTQTNTDVDNKIYLSQETGFGLLGSSWYCSTTDESGIYSSAGKPFGKIWTTQNTGQIWVERTSSPSSYWNCCIAMSDNAMYQSAGALGGSISRSDDYGQTWNTLGGIVSSKSWNDIDVSADGRYQIASTYGLIYQSSDYGVSWTQNGSGYRISISDSGNKRFSIMENGGIIISNDYGNTWKESSSEVGKKRLWGDIACNADGNIAAAIESADGFIYVSIDGGATWRPKRSLAPSSSPTSCKLSISASGDRMLCVNSYGRVYFSNDTGETWRILSDNGSIQSICISRNGRRAVLGGSSKGVQIINL